MKLTIFNGVGATSCQQRELSWPEFAQWTLAPSEYHDKASCPLIKLATVGDVRTARGSLRHDGNIQEVWGIEGDYDGGQIAPEVAYYELAKAGIKSVIYTTPSHTEEYPRWRVIAPFEKKHQPAERREAVARLNGALGGILAKESFTLSQSFYFGKINGSHNYKAYVVPGQAIDCIQGLTPVYPIGINQSDAPIERDPWVFNAEVYKDLHDALKYVSSDDYHTRIAVGQALSHLGDAGFLLYATWHGDAGREFTYDTLSKWATFDGVRTGYQAIFNMASAHGWINPASHKPLNPKDFKFVQGFIPPVQVERELTEFSFTSADDMIERAAPIKYLIKGIMQQDSIGIMAAQSMAYKSFMALEMAHCICTGRDFFTHKIKQVGKVLYICGEGKGGLTNRMAALKRKHGGFNGNFYVMDNFMSIDDEEDMRRLALTVQKVKPVAIIFDTLSSLNSHTNENDSGEVAHILASLRKNLSNGLTSIMIIHHFGKDSEKGMRGSSAFLNNVDFVYNMTREKDSQISVLSCKKAKDGNEFRDITVEAEEIELGFDDDDGYPVKSLVLNQIENIEHEVKVSIDDKRFKYLVEILTERPVKTTQEYDETVVNYLTGQGIKGQTCLNFKVKFKKYMLKTGKMTISGDEIRLNL